MKKKYVGIAIVILALSISTTAFAASSTEDALSKLKDIGQAEQSNSSEVLLPDTSNVSTLSTLPTVAEIKAELGDQAKDQLATLQAAAEASTDATDHLKLAIALELTGDNSGAMNSLHKAISLAPNQKELYEELVTLYQADSPGKISVFINGDKVNFKDGNDEVDPVILNGSTLIPIRKITEKLGAKVDWDPKTLTANIRLLDTSLQLTQDSTNALVNGQPVSPALNVPAKNLNGHIVVPLRFVGEQFNKTVDFISGENGTAIITIVDKS